MYRSRSNIDINSDVLYDFLMMNDMFYMNLMISHVFLYVLGT